MKEQAIKLLLQTIREVTEINNNLIKIYTLLLNKELTDEPTEA